MESEQKSARSIAIAFHKGLWTSMHRGVLHISRANKQEQSLGLWSHVLCGNISVMDTTFSNWFRKWCWGDGHHYVLKGSSSQYCHMQGL